MSKTELGTKRVDPETGKKFYDLNRDPVISPYTGISYPRSYFENSVENNNVEKEDLENESLESVSDEPEFISLADSDEEEKHDDVLPDLGDDDVNIDDSDVDDVFLQEDDEEEDVTGIIGGGINKEDDN